MKKEELKLPDEVIIEKAEKYLGERSSIVESVKDKARILDFFERLNLSETQEIKFDNKTVIPKFLGKMFGNSTCTIPISSDMVMKIRKLYHDEYVESLEHLKKLIKALENAKV